MLCIMHCHAKRAVRFVGGVRIEVAVRNRAVETAKRARIASDNRLLGECRDGS